MDMTVGAIFVQFGGGGLVMVLPVLASVVMLLGYIDGGVARCSANGFVACIACVSGEVVYVWLPMLGMVVSDQIYFHCDCL